MPTAKKRTVRMKATKVDTKKPKVDTKARQAARKAELAATAKEEELAKTLVKRTEYRRLATRVKEVENLVSQNYEDIIHLDNRIMEIERCTMWDSVRKFFSRKVW